MLHYVPTNERQKSLLPASWHTMVPFFTVWLSNCLLCVTDSLSLPRLPRDSVTFLLEPSFEMWAQLRRVAHLDLKSSNVLIAADGTAKISDVGLAALISRSYLSQMAPAGTWAWVAPEVILGGRVTHKADIFSFGVVLWEIITLERPAWRGNLRDIRCAHNSPPWQPQTDVGTASQCLLAPCPAAHACVPAPSKEAATSPGMQSSGPSVEVGTDPPGHAFRSSVREVILGGCPIARCCE